MRISFFFFFFFSSWLLFSQSDEGWKLVKQQKGIDVYVKSIPESPVNAVKATTTLDCSITSAVAAILDVPNHSRWMYQCNNAKVLKMINDSTWYYYAQSSTPWPVLDRDYVSKIVARKTSNNSISVAGKGIPDYLPEKKDIIRLPYSESEWKFTSLDPDEVYVELFLSVDVGGSVPPWLLNLFISRGPYQTMLNFSIMVHDKKYRDATLPACLK